MRVCAPWRRPAIARLAATAVIAAPPTNVRRVIEICGGVAGWWLFIVAGTEIDLVIGL